MKIDEVRKVAVLGGGVMGHGIAQVAAVSGHEVVVRDIAQEFLENARQGIVSSLGRLVERGRMEKGDAEAALARINTTLDIGEAVREADVVIEAVPERMELKRSVWGEASKNARGDAVLATNTSSLSITEMAEAVSNPKRFVGMHFFNPPALMKLVEVIPGEETSQETISLVEKLALKMGKTPVAVRRDSPGFIVNRVLITYLNEAAKLLERGYGKEQIDAAMQYGAKMPLGPFMLADLIGIDTVHHILKVFEEKLGPDYGPAEPIEMLYNQRKLGRKTGEGFYGYEERPSVSEERGEGFNVNLLLGPFKAEAEKLVEEGVADRGSVDTAMKLGANIPRGPFEMAASEGC